MKVQGHVFLVQPYDDRHGKCEALKNNFRHQQEVLLKIHDVEHRVNGSASRPLVGRGRRASEVCVPLLVRVVDPVTE